MNTAICSAENISVTLNNKEILKDVSFTIHKRDVFVILGPNGAGKTTLLHALLNLIPHEGTVSWSTKNISYAPPQEECSRKEIPPITVKEFFKLKKAGDKEILDLIEEVGLSKEVLHQQYAELSTGQFQRMLLAWALIGNPSVLLLDEPTSGIDVAGEKTIYSLIHNLWEKRNLTIILITHDLNVVWGHATKVLCLNKRKLCEGDPKTILTPKELQKLYGENVKFYKHEHAKE